MKTWEKDIKKNIPYTVREQSKRGCIRLNMQKLPAPECQIPFCIFTAPLTENARIVREIIRIEKSTGRTSKVYTVLFLDFKGHLGRRTGKDEIQVTKRKGNSVARAKVSKMQNPSSRQVSRGVSTFSKTWPAFNILYISP